MKIKTLLLALGASTLLQACSSTPREFVPALAALPVDRAKFEADYAYCQQLLVEHKLGSGGRVSSAASGAGAAAGVGAAGGMAASTALYGSAVAIASATLIALPVVAVGGALGAAKVKRKSKETAGQWIMTGCLRSKGYEVAGWQPVEGAK